MGGTVCTLSGPGRHSLSTVVTALDLVLSFAGETLVLVALFVKFVLETRVAVVIGNHGGALSYFLIAVGCVLCFVSMAAAKVGVSLSPWGARQRIGPQPSWLVVRGDF